MQIPAVILAAGASRRLGRPKQLVLFKGETLLNRAIFAACDAGAAPVLVVLGANFEEIVVTLPLAEVMLVHNEQWETGMASSIHAGMRTLQAAVPDADAVLLLTCDQPRLSAAHLRELMEASGKSGAVRMAASKYAGTRGTPAVLPRYAFAELKALQGDKGARSILTNPSHAVVDVAFPGGEFDVDEPEDLDRLIG